MTRFLLITLLLTFGSLLFNLKAQAPPNDHCDQAILLTAVGSYDFTCIGADTDGPAHANDCPSSGSTPDSLYNDVWYRFTSPFTGLCRFGPCGTADFDTKIMVYGPGAACPPTDNDVIACNEDGGGCSNFTSVTFFDVVQGETYLLRIGGYGDGPPGEEGMGSFIIEEYIPSGPPNDACANAIVLDLGPEDSVVVDYTTIDALTDSPTHINQSCFDPGETLVHNNVWYKWVATFTGGLEWSNCGAADYDSRVAVYKTADCLPDINTLVGCSDDGIDAFGNNCPGFTSRALFPVIQGETYLFSVGGWSGSDVGSGLFMVKKVTLPDPPSNDQCVNADSAWVITEDEANNLDVVHIANTQFATWDDQMPRPTCRPTGEFWDVWFRFHSGLNDSLEFRFIIPDEPVGNDATEYIIDMFSDCGEPDTGATKFCMRTDQQTSNNIKTVIYGFPGQPTWYWLRVATRVTAQKPGIMWVQIVGEPYLFPNAVTDKDLEHFSLVPNPAEDLAKVSFGLASSTRAGYQLLDPIGRSLVSKDLGQLVAGEHNLNLDLGNLYPGVYFFRLQLDGIEKTVKLIKI
jgi:hypothetical protein